MTDDMRRSRVERIVPEPAVESFRPDDTYAMMKAYFGAQKKVAVRILKDKGDAFVQVNGYTFIVQAGAKVEVPEQIAQMLEDGGYI